MANQIDLVTKTQVEQYLNQNNPSWTAPADQSLIPLAITAVSRDWLKWTGRRSLNRFVPCNDFFDGSGGDRQFLRDFPAAIVSAVFVNGIELPQGGFGETGVSIPGWSLDRKRESISLVGFVNGTGFGISSVPGGAFAVFGGPLTRQWLGQRFGSQFGGNRQNVQIEYFGGGQIAFQEMYSIPTSAPYQVTVDAAANFYMDLGVMLTAPVNGQLVQLAPELALTFGYQANPANGQYTFNPDLAGLEVSITYAYNGTPEDIQQAALIQIATMLNQRKQIGLKSQGSPETGTTSYQWDIPRPVTVQNVMYHYKAAMTGM